MTGKWSVMKGRKFDRKQCLQTEFFKNSKEQPVINFFFPILFCFQNLCNWKQQSWMPGSWSLMQWQKKKLVWCNLHSFLSCSYTEPITWMNTFPLSVQFALPPLSQGCFHTPVVMPVKTKVSRTCCFSRTKQVRETKVFISLSHSLHDKYERLMHWCVAWQEKKSVSLLKLITFSSCDFQNQFSLRFFCSNLYLICPILNLLHSWDELRWSNELGMRISI